MSAIAPNVLENHWVRLEAFQTHHREPLRQGGNDPDLWRFHALNQHNATFDRYFDHYLAETAAGRDGAYAVIDIRTGRVVGSSCLLAITPAHKRLEIGST